MTRIPSSMALLCLLLFGCIQAADDDAPVRRGGIGKADLVGSCVDTSCDGPAPEGNCWCDSQCAEYGDCCEDKTAACDLIECGGFTALPCPDGLVCVDNPLDSCDPATGGADCGGMCVEAPGQCGGFAGLQCGAGEYCHYDLGQSCGAADQLGVCKTRPDACIALYAPVCGCDGQTYSNECNANSAGVSAAADGACATQSACDAAGGFCVSGGVCPADTVGSDESCEGDPSGGTTCCRPGFFPPPPPAGGSCVDQCGGSAADGTCYCDDQCGYYGDCCDDYAEVCN